MRNGGLVVVACLFIVIGFTQLPDLLLMKLENEVAYAALEAPPAGIIVLGGGVRANENPADRTGFDLGDSADRLIYALILKRQYPNARFIFTGGLATLQQTGRPEASAVADMVEALYGDSRGIELEPRARNTYENGRNVAQMIGDDRDQPWVLVTSAFHMPRAVGVFRTFNINIQPAPVDYRAEPLRFPYLTGATSYQFLKMAIVSKEIIGRLAYFATGRTL